MFAQQGVFPSGMSDAVWLVPPTHCNDTTGCAPMVFTDRRMHNRRCRLALHGVKEFFVDLAGLHASEHEIHGFDLVHGM